MKLQDGEALGRIALGLTPEVALRRSWQAAACTPQVVIAYSLVICTCLAIGLAGVRRFGTAVAGNVLASFPHTDPWAAFGSAAVTTGPGSGASASQCTVSIFEQSQRRKSASVPKKDWVKWAELYGVRIFTVLSLHNSVTATRFYVLRCKSVVNY